MAKVKNYICPKCFKKMGFSKVAMICTNTNINANCENAKEKIVIYGHDAYKGDKCPKCKSTLTMICPNCQYPIPDAMKNAESYPIAILGSKGAGKSNYVAVLIEYLKNKISLPFGFSMRGGDEKTIKRYGSDFRDPLFKHKKCLTGSDAGEVDPLIFIMEFDRKGLFSKQQEDINLTFFDTAGENLNSDTMLQEHNRYLSYSSSMILLLDPLQIMTVREQLEGKIPLPGVLTDPNDIVDRVINIVGKENTRIKSGKDKGKLNINMAVVFTKIDTIDSLLDPSSCLKNDSTHIRKGYFDKNDFEDENAEMKSLVLEWLGASICQTLESTFKNVGYFGVSALGSTPDIKNMSIPKFRPFRVADPFLWLLAIDNKIEQK